jgi:two-component system, NarL family, sensor kinase
MSHDQDFQLALIFAIGTAGMLLMAAAVVLFMFIYQKRMLREKLKRQDLEAEYKQKMLGAALESQETERIRIAKDLHDDVGMMLMTMRTYLNSVTEKSMVEMVVPDIRELVDNTHETIRRLSWDLMPSTLERFGLTQTIKEMCDRLSTRNSTPVEFREVNKALTLDKNQETLLYRIIQESVTNALKHSRASRIEIVFDWSNPFLYVSIIDNGVGFDFPVERDKIKIRQGLGLLNVESRVSILGGALTYKNNSPSGVVVTVKLKVSHDG